MEEIKKRSGKMITSVIWNGVASCLNLVLGMIVTPLVTNNIGIEACGYVSLAGNFVSYVTILTTALNSYATRYISIEYHKKNLEESKKYFNSVLFTNLIAGSIILAALLCMVFRLEYILVIPEQLIYDVKILFIFMFLNFLSVLLGNTFLASVYIQNRMDLSGFFRMCAYFIQIIILIVSFKYLKPHLWYVGASYLIFSLIVLISSYILYKKLTPELIITKRSYSKKAVATLVINGVWNSINSLGNVLNSGLDLFISNLMLTPIAMSEISIAKTIGSILCMLYQIISQVFQPQLLKTYATGNKRQLTFQFQMAMKVSGWISGVFFVGFVVLGKVFYTLWIPNQNIEIIYSLTVITLISYMLEGVVGPLYYIYTLTVKNKVPCIITLVGGVINVISMFFLLKYTDLGAYAVVGTTTVIMLFINLVTNPLYMARCLNIKWYSFYPTIIRFIIYNIFSIYILKIILKSILSVSWIGFVICGFIICIVASVFYFIIMLDKEEKNILKNELLIRKIKGVV